MAGARQPIELVIANGKKHLTKSEIKRRRATEPKASASSIIAPDYLPSKLKTEFDEIASKLKAANIMSDLDVDCLARYLLSKQMYLALTSKLISETKKNNYNVIEKLITMQDKAFKQCHSSASSLGLTITSRCKLVVPNVNVEKNPLLKVLNGDVD